MNPFPTGFTALPITLAILLSGCIQGPDYRGPQTATGGAGAHGPFVRASADVVAETPALAHWWRDLGDTRLDALVERGLSSAPSQAAAVARVRQARSAIRNARTSGLPSVSASGTFAGAQLPEGSLGGGNPIDGGLFSIGVDTMWEVDLWGASRRTAERVSAESGSAEARLADARVTLSAEIARTYVALLARKAGAHQIEQRRAVEVALVSHAEQRFQAGIIGRQPVEVARAQIEQADAEIASAQADQSVLADALSVLTGQEPGALDGLFESPADESTIPLPPRQVAIGDPAALIGRRPDIRVAERMLAAATAQIGLAEAARFPKLSFLGFIGLGGGNAGDVLDPDQLASIAIPRISWSFLDFGRARRGVEQVQFARDAAAAEYDQAVLAALQDVESSLARFTQHRIGYAKALKAAQHMEMIAGLEEQRTRAGTIGSSVALEAQRNAINARLGAIAARAELSASYATLAKALGLGWQDAVGEETRTNNGP